MSSIQPPRRSDQAIRAKGLPAKEGATWGYLVDKSLLGAVEETLIQPTFILDYPRDISPLAKAKPDDPTHVERFEFFIGGLECGNAFSELNDPIDQEQRFLEMAAVVRRTRTKKRTRWTRTICGPCAMGCRPVGGLARASTAW